MTTPAGPSHEAVTSARAAALRAAARDLVEIAETIQAAAVHATTALGGSVSPAALRRAPVAGLRAQRALAHAVTDARGLGYSPAGGRLATLAARLGSMAGAESLAVRVLATSLRLRIAAVALDHPELTGDPMLTRLIEAAAADRDLEAVRALRALLRDRGSVRALSALAPVFGEVLALRALLDENPLNDATAWLIATGKGYATADPLTGVSNRLVAALDRGEGAARRVEPSPGEAARLSAQGSLLGFLGNIAVLGNTGRVLIQSVQGADGVVRFVVQAPGIRASRVDDDSPQDILGAFSTSVLASSPYSRALAMAIDDYRLPPGAEVALVGHSAGGAAVLNLAQDREFCARHTVTHAVAVGSPIDFKTPADPRTWVASVTNQHDIIPTLDGQGPGVCADLHPEWYVVDYDDPTHMFPLCHSVERYIANLSADLPEQRAHIDRRLAAYAGRVVRTQVYLLFDENETPGDFPFLTVPTYPLGPETGAPEVPVRCHEGGALTACFAADPAAAGRLLGGAGLGPAVRVGRHALVVIHAAWNRRTSLGGHRELQVGVVVPGPFSPAGVDGMRGWLDLTRRADRRRSGDYLVGCVVDADSGPDGDDVRRAVERGLWGAEPYPLAVGFRLSGGATLITVGEPGDRVLTLRGLLGPGVPVPARDQVAYTRTAGRTLRSSVRARGRARAHPAPWARLTVGDSSHPLARLLRDLGLDGARPLWCVSSPRRRSLRDPGVSLPGGRPAPTEREVPCPPARSPSTPRPCATTPAPSTTAPSACARSRPS
ncbi:hypothetical protein [Spongiactinospora sp. TRM90649]|uniref:hypothetical protein n=1 Tax=Spongiactinospora sp. TRM90649 TaxID=3031114 RepID=UPI0023F8327F|nr:hypothetical protein [Spongiactinospora sp. TRM90649]MDF5753251.1 hypothetical protein [Spongiactinospora sp. TRM90649]